MSVIIHGVDTPGVARPVMAAVADAVEQRVAQFHIGSRQITFAPQHMGAVGKFARAHPPEEIEVFGHRAVTVRAGLARLTDRAPVLADLLLVEAVHIGLAVQDQLFGKLVELLKVVRGEKELAVPVEAQPVDIPLDGLDVFHVFGFRVGVVEAQMADAAKLLGHAEVETDGFGVADMEIAVGLWRKAGCHPAAIATACGITGHNVADKVHSFFALRRRVVAVGHRNCTCCVLRE